jgi:hypothetical protein
MLCLLLVCWVRENFSGGPGHIFPVWDSAVCSAGPVPIFRALSWSGWRDCTDFSFLWLCCSGYGTVEMVRGIVRFSFRFLQFAVSSLGGWMSVVGFFFYIIRCSLVDLWYFFRGFVFCKLLMFLNLLQVVQAE